MLDMKKPKIGLKITAFILIGIGIVAILTFSVIIPYPIGLLEGWVITIMAILIYILNLKGKIPLNNYVLQPNVGLFFLMLISLNTCIFFYLTLQSPLPFLFMELGFLVLLGFYVFLYTFAKKNRNLKNKTLD